MRQFQMPLTLFSFCWVELILNTKTMPKVKFHATATKQTPFYFSFLVTFLFYTSIHEKNALVNVGNVMWNVSEADLALKDITFEHCNQQKIKVNYYLLVSTLFRMLKIKLNWTPKRRRRLHNPHFLFIMMFDQKLRTFYTRWFIVLHWNW